MNIKKTLIMAVIAAVAVTVFLWDQQRLNKEQEAKEAQSRLVTPKKEQISEITVRQGGKTTQLVKQGEEWRIAQPIKVRGDETSINTLLDEIDRAKRTEPFDAKGKLEDYGLKTPEVKLEVKAAAAKYLQEVELGGKTTDGSEVYAHLPKEPNVFTVPDALLTQLTKPVKDFRYKGLAQASLDEATSAVLTYEGKTIELKKQGENWRLLRPIQGPADNEKVRETLNNITRVNAADFVDTHPLNMATLGLDKPAVRATFGTKLKDKPYTATLVVGKEVPSNTEQVYAMQQGLDYAITIAKDDLAKLKPSLDDLRDKKLFTLAEDNVGRMIFDMRGIKVDVKADTADKWSYADEPAAKLDQSRVNQAKADLLGLKATRFIDEPTTPSETGLDLPFLRLSVVSKDGKTTETVITGHTAKSDDFIYARAENTRQMVGLGTEDPKKFFLTRDQFLDKMLYNFDESLVKKVQVKEGGKTVTFTVQPSGAWSGKAEGATREFQVEGTKMTSLILSIGALNWSRRLDPTIPVDEAAIKGNKIDAPTREIVLLDAAGKELAILGQAGEKGDTTFIRRGPKEYFGINKMTFNTITSSLDEVLKPTAEKK